MTFAHLRRGLNDRISELSFLSSQSRSLRLFCLILTFLHYAKLLVNTGSAKWLLLDSMCFYRGRGGAALGAIGLGGIRDTWVAFVGLDLTLDTGTWAFLEGDSSDSRYSFVETEWEFAIGLNLGDIGVINLSGGAALGSSDSVEIFRGEIMMCSNGEGPFPLPLAGDANSERKRIGAVPNDISESIAGGSWCDSSN